MYKIDHTTAVAVRPAVTPAGTEGYFTEGDINLGIVATVVTGDVLNIMLDELSEVVAAGGLTNDKSDSGQILQALNNLYLRKDISGTYSGQILTFNPSAQSNAAFEIGYQGGAATTPVIDFHSGTTAIDFDTRIMASGGDGTTGGGDLLITAKNLWVVGGLVEGRDISADGTKLDGIEVNATKDQTAAEILTLIKTVDGAGSGLAADTLDGIDSTQFLRSDTSDVFTGATLTLNPLTAIATGLEIGYQGAASTTPYIDFHSGVSVSNYDARLLASGGDGTSGGGELFIQASKVDIAGTNYDYYNVSKHAEIPSLIAGTAAGTLIEGRNSAHFVIGLRANDGADSFNVIADSTYNGTYDKKLFTVKVDGTIETDGNKIWHEGNDGAGSGLDASKVDGRTLGESAIASTIVARDGNKDIKARLFRSEYGSANASVNYIMTQVTPGVEGDNYIRPSTPAQVLAALNVPDAIVASSYATNGYVKFTDGLIIQWGTSQGIAVDQIFPLTFPTVCYALTATRTGGYSSDPNTGTTCVILSTSTFRTYSGSTASPDSIYWIAIGK